MDLTEEFGVPREELFSIPLLAKAIDQSDRGDRIIVGLATVDTRDVADERLLTKGIDTTYLEDNGKINWEHGKDPSDWIGEVLSKNVGKVREIVPPKYWPYLRPGLLDRFGMWVVGKLYKGVAKADQAWNTLKNNPDARWGFSVQGLTLLRDKADPTTIVRAMVRHLALSPQPTNTDTHAFAALAKSLAVSYQRQDQSGGQAMVPQSLGPQVKDMTGARASLKRYLEAVENGSMSVLDATEAYFKATGVDSDTAKALVKFVRQNAGRIVAKGGKQMAKCKCGADLEKGLSTCPACTAKVTGTPEDSIEELRKALGSEEEEPSGETPSDKPGAEESPSDKPGAEESPSDKPAAGAEEKPPETEPLVKCSGCGADMKKSEGACPKCGKKMEKSLAAEDKPPAETATEEEENVLDVTELVKSVASGMVEQKTAVNILAKGQLKTMSMIEDLQKSQAALMERFGVLAKVPAGRGGKPVKVEINPKSFEAAGKAGSAGANEALQKTVQKLLKYGQAGKLTDMEGYALDSRRGDPEALLKTVESRLPAAERLGD